MTIKAALSMQPGARVRYAGHLWEVVEVWEIDPSQQAVFGKTRCVVDLQSATKPYLRTTTRPLGLRLERESWL